MVATYMTDHVYTPADIADAGRCLKAIGDETASLEERWLELSGEIEAAAEVAA